MDIRQNTLSFLPLGGTGDVTKNMYLYEYQNQILIVDCGLGFADETMLGVDLLLPDTSYLLKAQQSGKRIVGLLLTHGHEDHIGALPFILPQLTAAGQSFPVFASPFTATLVNEKLKEFRIGQRAKVVDFGNPTVQMEHFKATFIRVTHSVPDTSHIFIETPVGNFYHGSDFKFDDTPQDGKVSDYESIKKVSEKGVLCLLSDCLGSERAGRAGTEIGILDEFEKAISLSTGKVIVTTFSSHVARLNQVITAAVNNKRKVCFLGRSLLKAKDVAQRLGYLTLEKHNEVFPEELQNYQDNQLVFIVAGSQGQQGSGMDRVVRGEHRNIKLKPADTVIISAGPIPGTEIMVYGLIDEVARSGSRVLYTGVNEKLHVSGHGAQEELSHLISLVKPKKFIPIGGNFRHMVAYQNMVDQMGINKNDVLLLESGQEIFFSQNQVTFGKITPTKMVYVDEISRGEMESYVLRDRQKLSESGVVVVMAEIDSTTGQLVDNLDIIARGMPSQDTRSISKRLAKELTKTLSSNRGKVTNWVYIRKLIGNISERIISKEIKRNPLILPVVIEV